MATIKIDESVVISEHNAEYQKIKKKFPTGDIEYSYEYCVFMDGTEHDMSSKQKYVESVFSKWGVSIQGKQGRKKIDFLIKNAGNPTLPTIPSTIQKSFEDNYDELIQEELDQKTKESNLDSILKKVGKKGSSSTKPPTFKSGNGFQLMNFMNRLSNSSQPTYPTLEDLKMAYPEIYQEYISKSDGTKIISFKPHHKHSDSCGFLITNVLGAYKPLKKENNRVRIIYDETCNGCILYDEQINQTSDNVNEWISLQYSIIEKFNAAKEGEQFKGWKGAKEYKLTSTEISNFIKGRIFNTRLDY